MTDYYRRWKAGLERRTSLDAISPLAENHPAVGTPCWLCEAPLEHGQRVTLFAVGPDSPADAAEADAGRWINALAVIMHQDCAWPVRDETKFAIPTGPRR